MPAHKRQHYVPRCYLKPFSSAVTGASINVFNIPRAIAIPNAALKGQCAKNYIYGEDLELERVLQAIEGEYARVLRSVHVGIHCVSADELNFLRFFASLQYARTDMAAQRMRLLRENTRDATFEGRRVEPPQIDLSDRSMMRESLALYTKTLSYTEDLKILIIENCTQKDFITSDDPVVFTNKFHLNRLNKKTFGSASSGAMIFMPLSPRLALLCYDKGVYTIHCRQGVCVKTTDEHDVRAINDLQYMKAAENIYFRSWEDRERIKAEFSQSLTRRPETWHEVFVLVREGGSATHETYRLASEKERRTGQHTLTNTQACHNAPARWFSKLKYRQRRRVYSNGSAMGYVRKRDWLERDHNHPEFP